MSQSTNQQSVRFIYNKTPNTKEFANSVSIPNMLHFTPFHQEIQPPLITKTNGLQCAKCMAYLNMYCEVITAKGIWICCICKEHNRLEKELMQQNTEQPSEKNEEETSLSQILGSETYALAGGIAAPSPKLYIFLIDLCVSEKEMSQIKESLLELIREKKIEQESSCNKIVNRICLITYSKFVYVYDMVSKINTVVCISGNKKYATNEVLELIGINSEAKGKSKGIVEKYFANVVTKIEEIESKIKGMKAEQNFVLTPQRSRAKRSLGQGLAIATSISETALNPTRIITLIGGPCTNGVGQTISTDYKEQMRSIQELENEENLPYFKSSTNFYRELLTMVAGNKIVIDLFVFSIEETGLMEMIELVKGSGGVVVLGEEFQDELEIFKRSFRKAYLENEDNEMKYSLGYSTILTVLSSLDVKLNGAFGNLTALQPRHSQQISTKIFGHGNTNSWLLGATDCYSTYTLVYELSSAKAFSKDYHIQFIVDYVDYWGRIGKRITTVRRDWENSVPEVAEGFDEEAAIVGVVRWYLWRMDQRESRETLRSWIDKMLVKWAGIFGQFVENDSESFSLPERMKYLPQFFYYFRRNAVFRRKGLSVDELSYHSYILNRETIDHCITIIQPALLSYTIEAPYPTPVPLVEECMKNSAILLLDTYFHVVLWYGENIEHWEKEEFHKQKEYQNVKILLEAPQEDIEYLMGSRFPAAGFYKTGLGGSKERLLKSRISPKEKDEIVEIEENENTLTDDPSIETFMKVLVNIIVSHKKN